MLPVQADVWLSVNTLTGSARRSLKLPFRVVLGSRPLNATGRVGPGTVASNVFEQSRQDKLFLHRGLTIRLVPRLCPGGLRVDLVTGHA